MRWRFFAICLGLAAVALAAQVLVGSVLPGDSSGVGGKLNDFTTSTAIAAVVVLLTTPLQAAGEEYLFRGYLLQAVGSLFGNKWVAIGTTGLLFALAHGAQNFPLFFDRLAFGLIAAWLVTRNGYGNLSETLNVSEASWWNIVLTVTQSVVYAALVLYVARRMGLQTRTRPPATEPGPASSGPVDGSLATA